MALLFVDSFEFFGNLKPIIPPYLEAGTFNRLRLGDWSGAEMHFTAEYTEAGRQLYKRMMRYRPARRLRLLAMVRLDALMSTVGGQPCVPYVLRRVPFSTS